MYGDGALPHHRCCATSNTYEFTTGKWCPEDAQSIMITDFGGSPQAIGEGRRKKFEIPTHEVGTDKLRLMEVRFRLSIIDLDG